MKRKIDYFSLYFQGFFECCIYNFLLNCKKNRPRKFVGDETILMEFGEIIYTRNRTFAFQAFAIRNVLGNAYKHWW